VYPVKDILSGVVDIYHNKPFQIPIFESVVVSPEVLDKYVGVYTIPGTPAKFTITRAAAPLYAQMGGNRPSRSKQEHRINSKSTTALLRASFLNSTPRKSR
jgi:hypothetical protein